MNQPKISIIIPVYNAGHYFEQCLTSLVNQSLKEIEIILVLDCPSDGSDKVAKAFAAKDSRIRLIENVENLHTGLSRNAGMKAAQGKYIGFHDHDDYCEANMYELLYEKAELENLDIVRCNFSCIYTKSDGKDVLEEYKYPSISSKDKLYKTVSDDTISCVIWNHIYRTDFLRKHNLLFLDSRSICSEDSLFFIDAYNHIDKLGIVSDYLYYHIFHSSNTGKIYDYRSIENRISFFEELFSFLLKNGISEEQCQSFLSKNIGRSLYSGSRQAFFTFSFSRAIKEMKHIVNSQIVMGCVNSLYTWRNLSVLFQQKPTIILFFFILRLFEEK